MKASNLYKLSLRLSLLTFITAVICFLLAKAQLASPFLVSAFVLAAIGVRGYANVKGFAYTFVIFAATAAALCYPSAFITFHGFPLKSLTVPLLIIVMFAMGTHMNVKDFLGIIKTPKPVFVGLLCHYIVMPGLGFVLAYFSGLPPTIAAGIILVGCSPSGTASNVMAFISGGNMPLSVTITALSTLVAPVMTPLLMKLLASQLVPINFWEMLWSITQMVILPVIAGLIYNWLARGRWQWLDDLLPTVAMGAIAFIVAVIVAAGRHALLSIGPLLIILVLVHNLTGYFLGYRLSRFFRLREDEARTIAFEVGLQNAGLASGIAVKMGMVATMGLAPGVFGSLQNISASVLATWWKKRIPVVKNTSPLKVNA